MKVVYLNVADIQPYEKNAKKHPADQVEHIANSIREFGWQQPLVVDKDNVLVIGHGRLLAAKKLGMTEVPCAPSDDLRKVFPDAVINPLGDWTGGTGVDCGATNRKLGSDMGDSVTGGGLHGKDLSKADVSVNIYAWIKAQTTGETVELYCAIGDETVDGLPYSEIVDCARRYIEKLGGFEKFAEWGLIR